MKRQPPAERGGTGACVVADGPGGAPNAGAGSLGGEAGAERPGGRA